MCKIDSFYQCVCRKNKNKKKPEIWAYAIQRRPISFLRDPFFSFLPLLLFFVLFCFVFAFLLCLLSIVFGSIAFVCSHISKNAYCRLLRTFFSRAQQTMGNYDLLLAHQQQQRGLTGKRCHLPSHHCGLRSKKQKKNKKENDGCYQWPV